MKAELSLGDKGVPDGWLGPSSLDKPSLDTEAAWRVSSPTFCSSSFCLSSLSPVQLLPHSFSQVFPLIGSIFDWIPFWCLLL